MTAGGVQGLDQRFLILRVRADRHASLVTPTVATASQAGGDLRILV